MKLGPSGFWIKTAEKVHFVLLLCYLIWKCIQIQFLCSSKEYGYKVTKWPWPKVICYLSVKLICSLFIGRMKVYIFGWGHITKMAAMPELVEIFKNLLFQLGCMPWNLVCTISDHSTRKFLKCDPGLLWPKVKLEAEKVHFLLQLCSVILKCS